MRDVRFYPQKRHWERIEVSMGFYEWSVTKMGVVLGSTELGLRFI